MLLLNFYNYFSIIYNILYINLYYRQSHNIQFFMLYSYLYNLILLEFIH